MAAIRGDTCSSVKCDIHGAVEDESVHGNIRRERRRGRQDGDAKLRHSACRAYGDTDGIHLCWLVASGSVDDARWQCDVRSAVEGQQVHGEVRCERRRRRQDCDVGLRHSACRADGNARRVYF